MFWGVLGTSLVWEVKRTKRLFPLAQGGRGGASGWWTGWLAFWSIRHPPFGVLDLMTACFQLSDLSVITNMCTCEHAELSA